MKKLFIILSIVLICAPAYAAKIYFTDGTSISGKIVQEDGDSIVVREQVNPAVVRIADYLMSTISSIDRETPDDLTPREEVFPAERKRGREMSEQINKMREAKRLEEEQEEEIAQEVNAAEDKSPPSDLRYPKIEKSSEIKKSTLKKKTPKEPVVYNIVQCAPMDLPVKIPMIREECEITLPAMVLRGDYALPIAKLLEQRLEVNPQLDALWVTVYSRDRYPWALPSLYAIWAPPGGWDDYQHCKDKSQYQWEYRPFRR